MKKEIEFSKAIGKTIKGYAFSETCGQAVIVFTDGTFATLGIDIGYEAGEEAFKEEELDLHSFGDSLLDDCGIVTYKEMSVIRIKKASSLTEEKERIERNEYARLRRKYEVT